MLNCVSVTTISYDLKKVFAILKVMSNVKKTNISSIYKFLRKRKICGKALTIYVVYREHTLREGPETIILNLSKSGVRHCQ